MRNLTEDNVTQAVVQSLAKAKDPRTLEILSGLVHHMHAFIREVHLTEEEWMAGIQFLTATGHKCDSKRQEFILLSDTLGATTQKDLINHRKPSGATEYTILGPFHRPGAPEFPSMGNLAGNLPGDPVVVRGRVLGRSGIPLTRATLDVWQADSKGFYDLQMADPDRMALRGVFRTDQEGKYAFRTLKPTFYPIPTDGPVGQMLLALGRHPYRPAHIHFIVAAKGYVPVTTELFEDGDPYLDSDAVFGVRQSLVVKFRRHETSAEAAGLDLSPPFYTLDHDFVLEPE